MIGSGVSSDPGPTRGRSGDAAAARVRPVAGPPAAQRDPYGGETARPARPASDGPRTPAVRVPTAVVVLAGRGADDAVGGGPFEAPPFARPGAARSPAGLLAMSVAPEGTTGDGEGGAAAAADGELPGGQGLRDTLARLVSLAYRRQGADPPVYPALPAQFRVSV